MEILELLPRAIAALLTAYLMRVTSGWTQGRDKHHDPRIVRYGKRTSGTFCLMTFLFGAAWIGGLVLGDLNVRLDLALAVFCGTMFWLCFFATIETFRRRIEITDTGLQARFCFGSTFVLWEDIVDVRTYPRLCQHVIKVRRGRNIWVPGSMFHDVDVLRYTLKARVAALAGHPQLEESWELDPFARPAKVAK